MGDKTLLIYGIRAAGAVLLLIASSNMILPGLLRCTENLARVSSIVRQVFVVHWLYIVLVVLGSSALCFLFAPRLAAGDPLGRALAGFLAAFWLLRFLLQLFYYDREIKSRYRVANVAYTLACLFLSAVFAAATLDAFR